MKRRQHPYKIIGLLFCLSINVSTKTWAAASDEIQVYDNSINAAGKWGAELHINTVPYGVQTPSYAGEIPAHHSTRITPEFAYGLGHNLEAGFYLPTIQSADGTWYLEGAKLRLKYIPQHAEYGFYWGFNSEVGRISRRTEQQFWNLELRPILGYRLPSWHIAMNPNMNVSLSGNQQMPAFDPAIKIGRHLWGEHWLNIEHYVGLGNLDNLSNQTQETYLTLDTVIFRKGLNVGVGRGSTAGSNTWTIKAIIEFD